MHRAGDFTLQSDIVCTNCHNENSMRRDFKEGFILCESCGFISEKGFIDHTAEYRIFSESSSGSDPRRTGGIYNENLDSGGLGTMTDNQRDKASYYTEKSLIGLDEKKFFKGQKMLKDWCHGLHVEERILNTAMNNFEKLLKEKKMARKPLETMLATILFLASKLENNPINLAALENHANVSRDAIRKCANKIRKYMPSLTYTSPAVFAESFGSKLGLPQHLIGKAKELARKIDASGIFEGKNPRNIAGMVLCIISNYHGGETYKRNLQEISRESSIAENTIKSTLKMLIPKLVEFGYSEADKKKIESLLNIRESN